MRQLGHTDPGFTLRVYTHMMVRSPEERERLKALVRGERVARPSAARPLDGRIYEAEILKVLADHGGSAPRRNVIAAVGGSLSSRHGAIDLEELPSGPPRWEPRVGKARLRLVTRGWLKDCGRGSDWCLTRAGMAKVRRDLRPERVESTLSRCPSPLEEISRRTSRAQTRTARPPESSSGRSPGVPPVARHSRVRVQIECHPRRRLSVL